MKKFFIFISFLIFFVTGPTFSRTEVIKVGSKNFTESYILAEIISQIIESTGKIEVERKFGLGGTGITFNALKEEEIHVYPEYTGTIKEAILKAKTSKDLTISEINRRLDKWQLAISMPIGFNNTYALAVTDKFAIKNKLTSISDLKNHNARGGFTHEFVERSDGFNKLAEVYGLNVPINSMEHSLAYEAINNHRIDVMDVYSTDAKILKYNLKVLEDDKNFFPQYQAVLLYNRSFLQKFPTVFDTLETKLVGHIDEEKMRKLNSLVEVQGFTFAQAAKSFLSGKVGVAKKQTLPWQELSRRTIEHLKLVFVSLFFATLIGIPLGVLAHKSRPLAQVVLSVSGLMQTIPSLALLCFLIPFMGIGKVPSYTALFLYGLLPIVRNTMTGLGKIENRLMECAQVMGLKNSQKLLWIQLPLASDNIMTGIKTSAIINVGTATLAAFIGGGGLGSFIVTGLALNNTSIILQGAVPAALLSLLVQGFFEILDRFIVPAGIRKA